jgi:hypothetical protein
VAATQAKLDAGAPDVALRLLASAQAGPLDELQRARVDLLRARIAMAVNRGRDAAPLLLAAAQRLAPLDAALARETYLEALDAAIFAGRLGRGTGVLRWPRPLVARPWRRSHHVWPTCCSMAWRYGSSRAMPRACRR